MSWGSQGNGPDSKSSDPPPRGSVRYFIERIPQERPSWFRHFFREFTGNWDELHEALLDLLRRHEGRLNAQVHIALILLCAGHAGGVEVLLDAIRKPNKPRVYALKELHSIWANERFARGGKPLPMAMQDLVLAMAPLLKDPALPGGKEALEFCLDFALQESLVRTRQLFTHADPEIRCQVAAAFIECGASESALGAASVHWLAPLPGAEESLRAWRRRSQACARPIPRYWQKDATEPMKALRERAAAIATHAVRKTLQMHDAPTRTWHPADHIAGEGYFIYLLEVVAHANTEEGYALLQQVVLSAMVAPFCRAKAALLLEQHRGRIADGATQAVVSMVLDKAVPASGRSRLLQACARSLDVHAVDGLIAGLQEPELVSDVTKVLASAPRNGRDPEIEAALLAVLKSGCPAWVAANVAATLLAMGNTDDASLAALDPWGATDFRWQQQGITPVEVARRLTEAGAIAGISEQALAAIGQRKAASLVLHLLSHDAKDVRVALGTIRSNCSPEHHELFSQLARIVRPPLQIESISEITTHEVETVQDAGSAGLMMMQEGVSKPVPQHLVAGIPLVSISDTRRRVTVRSEGREFAFTVSPPGAFTMDVAGVLAGFNDIMKQIGREERAFQLDWERDDTRDHGYFLCAREEPFLKAAADLCIPLRVPS